VQICILYPTAKTGRLYRFKRLSYLSLNMKSAGLSMPPPHLKPEMEMKLVGFFIRFGVPDY
jgi:hypothetical protein